jgi:RNA polymerase nonessential primary-like sigma factor
MRYIFMQEIYKNYETEELVVLFQKSHNDTYLQEIIRRNKGLIHRWVICYNNIPFYDIEDLVEESYIALWRAVESFAVSKGYTFSTYLKGCVKQRLNRLYNEATRRKRFVGSEPYSYDDLKEINKEVSTDFELFNDLEVKEFISSLDEKAQYIAVKLLEGYTKGDIAKALGITPASTTYHIKRLENLAVEYFELRRI